MKKVVLAFAAMLSLSVTTAFADSSKREFRSSWVAGMGIDWPYSAAGNKTKAQQQLRDYLDKFKAQNFTGVCIHVRPRADAYYKSTLEPWSADLSGTRGKDPGWDPLAFAVEECHKRGLECYAWINPFRVNANSATYTTSYDNEWRDKGWLMKGVKGTWTIFNPGVEGARQHCLDVFKEIYTNYDIDGMLFDDYFYPGEGMPGAPNDDGNSGKDSDSDDYQLWKNSGSSLSLYDWRRNNVNTFVQAVYDEIQAERPDMRFGIGPAGVGHASAASRGLTTPNVRSGDWQYSKIYSDCLAWLADGSIDFIGPQIYWQTTHSTAPYGPLCDWWSMASDHYNRHCYISIASYKVEDFGGNNASGWGEIAKQVTLCRDYTRNNSSGQIYYNTKSINGPAYTGLGDYLGANSYESKALVPLVDWKTRVVYPAVSSLKYSAGTLSWDATSKKGRAIVRYTVYAIPNGTDLEAATSADGDGIDCKYLVDVTYSPSYTLPTDKASGHWYAVCVYDGYGYESDASYYGYSVEPAPTVTLVSPADKATVESSELEFKWTAAPASWNLSGYRLEIYAKTSEFSATEPGTCVIMQEIPNTSTTSCKVFTSLLGKGEFAWRVVSEGAGYKPAGTDFRTFTITNLPIGGSESGYTVKTDPADYPEHSTDRLKFESLWYRSAHSPFGNMSFESNGALNRGMVAVGNRVYVSGRKENSSTSEIYLKEYDGDTGEHLRDITLSTDGAVPYYPCNDVFKDSNGNVCISNLSLNISATPVMIFKVNLQDGSLTKVAHLLYSKKGRVDHVGVYGDVTSGSFTAFAAMASGTEVVRWRVTGPTEAKATATGTTISGFYPTGMAHFGIAPRVYPVSDTRFYVDGGSTAMTLYEVGKSAPISSFSAAASAAPAYCNENGCVTFSLGDKHFVAYSHSPASQGGRFALATTPAQHDFSGMEQIWTFPQGGLGNVESTTCSAPVDAVVKSQHEANVYAYIPGNGLAAYRLSLAGMVGVESVIDDGDDCGMTVDGLTVRFSATVKNVAVYNPAGMLVKAAADVESVALPTAGVYLVNADGLSKLILVK